MTLQETLDNVIDRLDSAAKAYPLKALAPMIRGDLTASKAESTLRNELSQQPGYKLGLVTAIQIIHHTGDLAALDAIEVLFGRTAWSVPEVTGTDPLPVMGQVGRVSKEFSDVVEVCAKALEDGRMELPEIDRLLNETGDLIVACIRFKAVLSAMRAAADNYVPRPARREK
jgi:hypothetical protein